MFTGKLMRCPGRHEQNHCLLLSFLLLSSVKDLCSETHRWECGLWGEDSGKVLWIYLFLTPESVRWSLITIQAHLVCSPGQRGEELSCDLPL